MSVTWHAEGKGSGSQNGRILRRGWWSRETLYSPTKKLSLRKRPRVFCTYHGHQAWPLCHFPCPEPGQPSWSNSKVEAGCEKAAREVSVLTSWHRCRLTDLQTGPQAGPQAGNAQARPLFLKMLDTCSTLSSTTYRTVLSNNWEQWGCCLALITVYIALIWLILTSMNN